MGMMIRDWLGLRAHYAHFPSQLAKMVLKSGLFDLFVCR